MKDLHPSAERTALLYHQAYLCLGKSPKLEHLIREQALDTQLLFGSSEAVLMKCVSTSSNLVSSLFPMLMTAFEKNKPLLAVKYLEKARTWIDDIIRAMDEIVKRYDQQTRSVARCTSDVIQEQKETEEKLTKHTKERESLLEDVGELKEELKIHNRKIEALKRKTQDARCELRNHVTNSSEKQSGVLESLVELFAAYSPAITAKTQCPKTVLSHLTSEKNDLQAKKQMIQDKLSDLQLKLSASKIQLVEIPSPVHLEEIQQCLSRIQQILIELQKFWEKVRTLLDSLKDKTCIGEDLKEEILTSIKAAGKCWQRFGECCQRAQVIFSVQSQDAFKFLETSPSSLSEDEWEKQHKSIMKRLNEISSQESTKVTITEK